MSALKREMLRAMKRGMLLRDMLTGMLKDMMTVVLRDIKLERVKNITGLRILKVTHWSLRYILTHQISISTRTIPSPLIFMLRWTPRIAGSTPRNLTRECLALIRSSGRIPHSWISAMKSPNVASLRLKPQLNLDHTMDPETWIFPTLIAPTRVHSLQT